MVGQQLDLLERGRVRQAQGGLFKIFIRVVDARDDRDANAEGLAAFFQPLQIFQDRLVRHAGVVPVPLRVHELEVHHDVVYARKHGGKDLAAAVGAGLDGAVHGGGAVQHFQEKFRLAGRLAAGEGDAAAHGGQIVLVAQELFGERRSLIARAAELPQPLRAGADAPAAGRAVLPAVWAGADAGAAVQAVVVGDHQLRLIAEPLRVVAPHAPQRAALEKDGRADAGAVIDRHLLDVKYSSGGHPAPQPLTWRTSNSRRSL